MITRISTEHRAWYFETVLELLKTAMSEMMEILNSELSPRDSRNFDASTPDEIAEHCAAYDDKDAPLFWAVIQELERISDSLSKRYKQIKLDDELRNEALLMFMAWDCGLCPYVIREYEQKNQLNPMDIDTLQEIAKLLDTHEMSRQATIKAVETWLKKQAFKKSRQTYRKIA